MNFGISVEVEGSKGKVKVNKYTESFDIKIQYFNYYSIAGVRQGPDGLEVNGSTYSTNQYYKNSLFKPICKKGMWIE